MCWMGGGEARGSMVSLTEQPAVAGRDPTIFLIYCGGWWLQQRIRSVDQISIEVNGRGVVRNNSNMAQVEGPHLHTVL